MSATNFMDKLSDTLTNGAANVSVTENGALGYKTTGKKLVDLNFATSSLRSKSEAEIEAMFADALAQNVNEAIVWLFFCRDVRGGMGERRTFRICMKYLAREFPVKTSKILPLIAEYGRWDDLFCLIGTYLEPEMLKLIAQTLVSDLKAMKSGESVTLLAKWLPSINASSKDKRNQARYLAEKLRMTYADYQKMCSALRKHLNIVERKMSSGEWGEINYEHVPSKANLLYNSAFLRHDEYRRRDYLGRLAKGEAKINSSTLFPHDIVHKYGLGHWSRSMVHTDDALEAMWKALPNTVENDGETIVVADGSGSMWTRIGGNTDVTALEVANALAIYFAERLAGPYKDKYITFSTRPQLVDLAGSTTLLGKMKTALRYSEVADTNIEAVFDLVLETALRNHLKQEDLPKNILIISDMEFNSCATSNRGYGLNAKLFDVIATRYAQHGYKLPRLVFWNVNSRTGTIPVKENDLGVALVSGFSPNVAKMVMSGKIDPADALREMLTSERYRPVWDALLAS